MIYISEKCQRSLDQEPGGPMCVQYSYRVSENSIDELLKLKGGTIIIEMLSDDKINEKQISEILGVEQKRITIEKNA